jgi:Polyketide cyclase / dehydrase and lipid transport
MARIRVSTTLPAPPSAVWASVSDLASHVDWMADAESIRFTTRRRSGVGTAMEVATRVGPFRLTDLMEVTEWRPGRAIGVRHDGLVGGTGRFTLGRRWLRPGSTRFTWEERLEFPPWLGGPLGAAVAAPVLRWVWTRNLRRLREHFVTR